MLQKLQPFYWLSWLNHLHFRPDNSDNDKKEICKFIFFVYLCYGFSKGCLNIRAEIIPYNLIRVMPA